MPKAHGLLFLLLSTGLQWAGNNAESPTTIRSISNNTNISPMTFRTSAILLTAPTNLSDTTNESTASDSNIPSTDLTSNLSHHHSLTSKPTYQPSLTTEAANHSWANLNNTSPSVWPTATSRGDEDTTYVKSTATESNSFTTITHNISFTTLEFYNTTQGNGVTFQTTKNLSDATTRLIATKSMNGGTELWTTSPITNLPSTSHDSNEGREHQKANPTNGAVIFGAIVGTVLGLMLISLAGYFICGKRKSEQFGHQRLYDDTRNDPVLRLDIEPEPYAENFGDLSYNKTITSNENATQNSKETSYDSIPMDDITSSQLSAEVYKN